MSKHKNRLVLSNLKNVPITKSDSKSIQQHSDNNDINLHNESKKEISGLWILVIVFGLLILVFILGWLTR